MDISPSLEMAWATAFPYGHDNDTQFTATHYRAVAKTLGLTLSRTAYRHPDGNAFIERTFGTLKGEAIWPNEFDSYEQAPAEARAEERAEAAQHKAAS